MGKDWQSLDESRKEGEKVIFLPEREKDQDLSIGLSGEWLTLN